MEVTLALAGEALALGGLAANAEEGRAKAAAMLASGKAAEIFGRMIAALGGPTDFIEKPGEYLKPALVIREVHPHKAGTVASVNCREVGIAVIELGGGRRLPNDRIDFSVGFSKLSEVGEEVGPNQPLALVHARDEATAEAAASALRVAYRISAEASAPRPMILSRLAPP